MPPRLEVAYVRTLEPEAPPAVAAPAPPPAAGAPASPRDADTRRKAGVGARRAGRCRGCVGRARGSGDGSQRSSGRGGAEARPRGRPRHRRQRCAAASAPQTPRRFRRSQPLLRRCQQLRRPACEPRLADAAAPTPRQPAPRRRLAASSTREPFDWPASTRVSYRAHRQLPRRGDRQRAGRMDPRRHALPGATSTSRRPRVRADHPAAHDAARASSPPTG